MIDLDEALALLAQAVCLGASAAGQVTGKLERRAGYELASVRYVFADGSYGFAEVRETAENEAAGGAGPSSPTPRADARARAERTGVTP